MIQLGYTGPVRPEDRPRFIEACELTGRAMSPRLVGGERVIMQITSEDYSRINLGERRRPGFIGSVQDLETELVWDVYGAACDTPSCWCDKIIRNGRKVSDACDSSVSSTRR